jgi:hypothetical protein
MITLCKVVRPNHESAYGWVRRGILADSERMLGSDQAGTLLAQQSRPVHRSAGLRSRLRNESQEQHLEPKLGPGLGPTRATAGRKDAST